MELYETNSSLDKKLQQKADLQNIPLGGTFEVTPLCNMNCKMCYVHLTKEEMDAHGKMLSCDEWIAVARQAREQGVLFLLLTGGEPLIYPEFKRLYTALTDMGFVISLNTNGTLINETWADFFAERPCRRINITLYGKDNETYSALCGNPQGFSQVIKAAELLKMRNVPFRFTCSVTPQNVQDQAELIALAKKMDVPYQPATYMFPGMRRKWEETDTTRLDPESAAQEAVAYHLRMDDDVEFDRYIHLALAPLLLPRNKFDGYRGFTCHAGHSGFWLNWKGEMTPCGMLNQPMHSVLTSGFENCWKQIVLDSSEILHPSRCKECGLQNFCIICPSAAKAESGSFDGEQSYLCRYSQTLARLLIDCLPERERPMFENILQEEICRNPVKTKNIPG